MHCRVPNNNNTAHRCFIYPECNANRTVFEFTWAGLHSPSPVGQHTTTAAPHMSSIGTVVHWKEGKHCHLRDVAAVTIWHVQGSYGPAVIICASIEHVLAANRYCPVL